MTMIKICGLRTLEHAQAATDAGANWLGFVFAPSRRQISVAAAAELITALRQQYGPAAPTIVGLFVNEMPTHVIAIAQRCQLDRVQLSGDETVEQLGDFADLPIVKAIRLDGSAHEAAWIAAAGQNQVQLLVDAQVAGAYGGTGHLANWEKAAALAATYPIMLAGGLSPENVGAALAQVHPWGVDVSSGVESNGIKDSVKIEAFIAAVRSVADL
jgi:phosphoribosylanthranilate isomerase